MIPADVEFEQVERHVPRGRRSGGAIPRPGAITVFLDHERGLDPTAANVSVASLATVSMSSRQV